MPPLPRPTAPTHIVVAWLTAWYFCSMVTLFANKTILTTYKVPVHALGIGQMLTTCALGAVKVYYGSKERQATSSLSMASSEASKVAKERRRMSFLRNLCLVGLMRGATVVLGLVSLQHVAASFVEAIKASAPLFTVVFAWFIRGEKTSGPVMASLIPVMLGLLITSGTELSFDTVGFCAALATNCVDCIQNVFSKSLMETLTPTELQFYTSAAAAMMQLPLVLYYHGRELFNDPQAPGSVTLNAVTPPPPHLVSPELSPPPLSSSPLAFSPFSRFLAEPGVALVVFFACCFYHLQSVAAYFCVNSVSPVTMSVANTLKRGILIVLSIVWFGNTVTLHTCFGMAMIVGGVALYNRAITEEKQRSKREASFNDDEKAAGSNSKNNNSEA